MKHLAPLRLTAGQPEWRQTGGFQTFTPLNSSFRLVKRRNGKKLFRLLGAEAKRRNIRQACWQDRYFSGAMQAMHSYFKDHSVRTVLRALSAVTLLTAISAGAQPAVSAEPAAVAPTAPAPVPEPAYTASTIALAFTYIDANKDGKLSRAEAAGFRGVAKYFDAADINQDGILSREEFDNAMNRSKPKQANP